MEAFIDGILLRETIISLGLKTILEYLLYALPKDSYEAAKIDGASGFSLFKYITLPLLKPMTLFIVITSIISYLQTYIQILVMTEGGPGTSTYVTSYLIFDEAFVKYNFGYASAISFIMFIVIAILTVISFKVTAEKRGTK